MKALLVAAVLVLAIPAAAAQTTLQGHLQASAVAADQTSDVTGKGLFIGFTQQHDRAAVDWSVTADTALVDITSYPSVVYAEAVAFPGGNPRHDTQTYTQASITRTLGTKPAANDFEFWMMVTPLPGHTATGFGLAGQLPTRDLVAQSSIFYICDPVAPAPTVMPTRQDSSGTGEVVYRDPQQALEWKPGPPPAPSS
ncbi:MAG: hypothetical protein QOI63_1186 [Thermoplasmata archaeon]|jgi:hypothetical protein|nr:hypothetical protein [Thermoplasmata archaeon]